MSVLTVERSGGKHPSSQVTDESPGARPEVTMRFALRRTDMENMEHLYPGPLRHAACNDFFSEARAVLLQDFKEEGARFVVAHEDIDYLQDIRHADRHVDVVVRVGDVGEDSFTVEHEIFLSDRTAVARMRAVMVARDVVRNGSRRLRAHERQALLGREGAGRSCGSPLRRLAESPPT